MTPGTGYRSRSDPAPSPLTLRFLPLAWSGIRNHFKRKLPMLLLYALPAGWMIYFSAMIFIKYSAEQGLTTGAGPAALTVALKLSRITIEVKWLISRFFVFSRIFSILIVAWFGAGLLCDDRRQGAHLLYFSRPLTRLDYVVGRFVTTFFYGALGIIVPGMFIVGAAAWMSPDWQFVRDEGAVIWGTLCYGLLTVGFFSMVALAASAVAPRKAFAMVGMFAAILLPHAMSRTFARAFGDRTWRIMSPLTDLGRVGDHFLGMRDRFYTWPVSWSVAVLVGIMVLCALVIALRIRRWEVVG